MSKLLKNLLIVLGIATVLLLAYVFFFKGKDIPSLPSGSDGAFSAEAEIETQHLLATINELNEFNVEGTIFSDPLFLSLTDFRTNIGTEPSGRPNPFLPI